ncbi:MAG TPA: DNA polymerase III subunit gamma/tau [Thermodesulfobacteriota bacterium]|nr:DNA polymerase III subunit gamma/tau [Thermodesulfobacteriota bacterium]
MSYLVLARKWRPRNFEEVVGQKPIAQALQNAIATNRVSHSYLFAGPRGVGKTSVARILAKALNCRQGSPGHPCDKCPSCQEIRDGISMDVLEIDGASNRGIDEIRDLRENVRYLPSKNKYKVYIIDEVHMLTEAAFNALLKTLEEPPAHVIFIFATTEAHKIPLTILSRCQRYDFKRIPLSSILEHLKKITAQEKVEIGEASLHLIARAAQGSMRDAQSLLDQVLSFSGPKVSDGEVTEILGVINRKILHDTFRALARGDAARLLQIVREVHDVGYDLKEFCAELAQTARDLLVLKIAPPASGLVDLPEEEVRELSAQGESFSREQLQMLFRSCLSMHDEVARSPFPRIVVEMHLTRLARKGPVLSVEEVLEKLNAMEERLLRSDGTAPPSGNSAPPAERNAQEPPRRREEVSDSAEDENAEGELAGEALESDGPVGVSEGAEEKIVREERSPEYAAEVSPETETAWKEFVSFAKKKKPPFASLLEHGRPVALSQDLLEIGYPGKSFYLDRMQEPDNLSLLQSFAKEFFQRALKTKVSGMNAGPKTKAEEPRSERKIARGREDEALNHPLVRDAIDIFGGRVVEIKNR